MATTMTSNCVISNYCDANRIFRWPLAAIAVSALSFLPACSTPSAFVSASDRFRADATAQNSTAADEVSPSGDWSTFAPELESAAPAKNEASIAGFVQLGSEASSVSPIRTAVLTRESAGENPAAKTVPLSHQVAMNDCPTCFTPAEVRIDPAFGRISPADLYPDEYLADGGDRRLPVHYFAGDRQGFDTEDTVAEYSDHNGKSHVRASNRVAIYSPRFGSVRVIEGADSGTQIHHAVKTTEVAAVGSLERDEGIQQSVKEDGFAAFGSRRRADGTEAKKNSIHSSGTSRLQQNDKIDQGLQAQATNGMAILERQQGAEFHQKLANAAIWSRDLFPKLSGATSQATEAKARVTAHATIGIEDKRAEKSEIHIVKLADRETAEAGDTIHFTIRFINTGDYDLHDVRVVDNLTPRLQFISGSANTTRDGDVLTQPNGEGSEILTFVLDGVLPAHESGAIEFDVRVK